MGLKEQTIVGYFPEFVFQFSLARVLVGLLKLFMNNFVHPSWACAAGFNNNNNTQAPRRQSMGLTQSSDGYTATLYLGNSCVLHIYNKPAGGRASVSASADLTNQLQCCWVDPACAWIKTLTQQ